MVQIPGDWAGKTAACYAVVHVGVVDMVQLRIVAGLPIVNSPAHIGDDQVVNMDSSGAPGRNSHDASGIYRGGIALRSAHVQILDGQILYFAARGATYRPDARATKACFA